MRKSRFITYLLVIFMAFSFTSCINFIEKVSLKKNGSGTYSLTLDMSKVVNMLKMMGQGDSESEMKEAMSSIDSTFQSRKEKLEAIEGISNARVEIEEKSLQVTMLYDFENVDALNRALNGLNEKEGEVNVQEEYFIFKKKTLTRTNFESFSKLLDSQMGDSDDLDFDPAMFFSDSYYKLILEFDRNIKKFSNDEYDKEDSRTISWKKYVFAEEEKNKNIEVTVKTK